MSEFVIRDFLSDVMEYPRHVVDAIMARLDVEAPGYNPAAWYRGGGGYGARGIAQWRGPRFERLNARAQANGTDWRDLGTQLQHFREEMRGPYAAVDRNLRASTNSQEALEIFTDGYEVPGPDPGGRARARNNLARIERSQPLANPPEPPGTRQDALLEISYRNMPPEALPPGVAGRVAPETPVGPTVEAARRLAAEPATGPTVEAAQRIAAEPANMVDMATVPAAPRVASQAQPATRVSAQPATRVAAQPASRTAAVSPTRTAPETVTGTSPQTRSFFGENPNIETPPAGEATAANAGGVGGKAGGPSGLQMPNLKPTRAGLANLVSGGPGGPWGNPNLPEGMPGALVPVSERPGLFAPRPGTPLSRPTTSDGLAQTPQSKSGVEDTSVPSQAPVGDNRVGDEPLPRTAQEYAAPAQAASQPNPLNPAAPLRPQTVMDNWAIGDRMVGRQVDFATGRPDAGAAAPRPVAVQRVVAPSATSAAPPPQSSVPSQSLPGVENFKFVPGMRPPPQTMTPNNIPLETPYSGVTPTSTMPIRAPSSGGSIFGGDGSINLPGGMGTDNLSLNPAALPVSPPVAPPAPVNPVSGAVAASGPGAALGQQVGGAVSNAASMGAGGKGGMAVPAVGGK